MRPNVLLLYDVNLTAAQPKLPYLLGRKVASDGQLIVRALAGLLCSVEVLF